MRLLMYEHEGQKRPGALVGDRVVPLEPSVDAARPKTLLDLIDMGEQGLALAREAIERAEDTLPLDRVRLLAPLDPPRGNVVAVGRNYQAHAEESARARGQEVQPPTVFTKAQTSITGPHGDVPLDPAITRQLDWEAELAVIIGRGALNVSPGEALSHVFGYTVANDLSARDIQNGWGGQFFKGKSLDGTCPLGPWIVTADEITDPQNLHIQLRLNGEVQQDASTRDMIRPVAVLVSQISLGMTLPPGTVIITGTPEGVGMGQNPQRWLQAGDLIETEIREIGALRNRVTAAQH